MHDFLHPFDAGLEKVPHAMRLSFNLVTCMLAVMNVALVFHL